MNAHRLPQINCRHVVNLLTLLVALSACSSTPSHNPDVLPPPVIVNDTRETPPDTAGQHPAIQTPETGAETEHEMPQTVSGQNFGEEVALRAIALVGKPYRYGGADLNGFDCSGLVFYIYHELGIELPRSAADQQRYATKVSRND
ncbi:MAG: NlpC/P60 family protein, partial [Steroidobacter sp.]